MDFKRASCLFFGVLFSLFFTNLRSQGKNGGFAYDAFDKATGAKNSGLCNGTIHFNRFRPADKTHRYFGFDRYVVGQVVFDGQPYGNVALKYDLLEDNLVVKFEGESNQMGFNAVRQKTESFYIDGKKFVNLDLIGPHPDFVKGFYEQTEAGNDLTLYTKYRKDRIEVMTNQTLLNTYVEKNDYVLNYKNAWYDVDSEKDFSRIFPEYATEIARFYQVNAETEKSNRPQFIKNLVVRIYSLNHDK